MHFAVDSAVDFLRHIRNGLHCVDCPQHVALLVVIENGSSLRVVALHTLLKSFCCVVLTVDQRLTCDVIDALYLRRIELHVV